MDKTALYVVGGLALAGVAFAGYTVWKRNQVKTTQTVVQTVPTSDPAKPSKVEAILDDLDAVSAFVKKTWNG